MTTSSKISCFEYIVLDLSQKASVEEN